MVSRYQGIKWQVTNKWQVNRLHYSKTDGITRHCEKSYSLGIKVSRYQGIKVSRYQGIKVSRYQGIKWQVTNKWQITRLNYSKTERKNKTLLETLLAWYQGIKVSSGKFLTSGK
jgi:hypothetical protein